jgi:hypothetical protein
MIEDKKIPLPGKPYGICNPERATKNSTSDI